MHEGQGPGQMTLQPKGLKLLNRICDDIYSNDYNFISNITDKASNVCLTFPKVFCIATGLADVADGNFESNYGCKLPTE